jgi:uncharacterized delta-60 repeat protein
MALVLFALILALPATAGAVSPGDDDPSFGAGGTTNLGLVKDPQSGLLFASQPDGKFVTAFKPDGQAAPVITRLNANGGIDTSFGSGGSVQPSFTTGQTVVAIDLLVAPDGTIYLCGHIYGSSTSFMWTPVIWAFTSTGAPKTSFAGDGERVLPREGADSDFFVGADFTPSGDLLYVTNATGASHKILGLHVLSPTGVLGAGSNPEVTGHDVEGLSMDVDSGGRVFVPAAFDGVGPGTAKMLAFTPALAFDSSFGTGGIQTWGLPGTQASIPRSVVTSGGRIYAGGDSASGASFTAYESNGQFPTVGSFGTTRLPIAAASAGIDAITADGAGKIVASGSMATSTNNGPFGAFISRFNADGTLDDSFGTRGVASLNPDARNASAVAVQGDGKYVVAALNQSRQVVIRRVWGGASPPPPVAALAGFSKSLKSKMKAKKFKTIKGTASGTGVTKVELAIQKIDSMLLKKKKRCSYVKSTKTTIKKVKAVKGKCKPSVWIKATGTTSWSVKLKKALKPGKYVLSVRATGAAGVGAVKTKKVTLTAK